MQSARAARGVNVRTPSPRMLAIFRSYLGWYVPRAFHAVRLAYAGRFPITDGMTPVIICVNHPSWWDPLMGLLLARRLAPYAQHYAPMEAAMLRHYNFMQKLGLFPLDTSSPRAGAEFLHASQSILATPHSVLWITPEGSFTDVRTRPAQWRPGAAALVGRLHRCIVVPVALEYTFWDERLPEALALVGEPLRIENDRSSRTDDWQVRMTSAMTLAQDELAAMSMTRSPAAFETVLTGGRGIAGSYDLWKRLQSLLHRQPYVAEHGRLPRV